MVANYHQQAFALQEELNAIEKEIKHLNKLKKEFSGKLEEYIKIAKATGHREFGGYKLKDVTKTRNSNVILIDKIKAERPDILWNIGTYAMPAEDVAWTEELKARYLDGYDYSGHYTLLLGQLDEYLGKKESENYKEKIENVTITTVVERVEKEPEDIIECD
jgi:hypothetical protein